MNCLICNRKHNNKKYCSRACQKIGAGNSLREFNKTHKDIKYNLGKKRPDMIGNSWNKGRVMTLECKEKIRKALIGKNRKKGFNSKHNLRRLSAYKIWRIAVFERDSYTCQLCNIKGHVLHADHIKPLSTYPELCFSLGNGRTLCVSCHYQVTFKRPMPKESNWGYIFK